MRLVVIGAGGQLGHDLVDAAARRPDVELVALDRSRLDLLDRPALGPTLAAIRPDAVVNVAAWTAVDACEGDPARAMLVNGTAVGWLAEACAATGAHLVQLSTDYVFDGMLDRPYREDDAPNPQSAYGRSKLAGERAASALGERATIVRTSWVCGAHGSNMVRTVLRLMAERDVLAFVDDQRGNPTFAADLAPMLLWLAGARIGGIVHVTNQGAVSWYEFAREIVAAAGGPPEMVRPISTTELDPPRPAPRPANSVLDNAVLRARGVELLRDFHAPLAELVAALRR